MDPVVGSPVDVRLGLDEHPRGLGVSVLGGFVDRGAADDDLRNQLVPVNQRIGLEEIISAADYYFESSGRRLTFEYVLLAGVNDSLSNARQLGQLLRGRPAMINVIPYNPVAGLPYKTPSAGAVRRFREVLEERGLNVQQRQRKGDKINAACGQLRRRVLSDR